MRIAKRLCIDTELGRKPEMSRTIKVTEFDGEDGPPLRSFFVLRAWMLWRARHHGWLEKNAARQEWHAREANKLKQDILRMGIVGGGTGSARADAEIRSLWLAALS